ncbi:MAG TPA: hypothetical protein VG323_07810 [Thermoanaerobaculia bacterium]|nr:hypothetical protein [Thermoanaerobaculia bacterium]
MRKLVFVAIAVLVALTLAPTVWAADDGNTQPKLGYAYLYYPNASVDAVAQTSGSGNVKGIHCFNGQPLTVSIYVNGGSAQTLSPTGIGGSNDSGWIPMNVRFTSSIKVNVSHGNYYDGNGAECYVSWALD